MELDEAFEEWRWRTQTEEALAYARLPNNGGVVFIGDLESVRDNVTLLIGANGGSEIPVVIVRNTDDNVRQLRRILDESPDDGSPTTFNGADKAVLEHIYRDFPAMSRVME